MSRTSRYSPPSSIFLLCVLLLVLAQPVCSQSLLGLQEKPRVILQGNTHPIARPEFDRGEAPADLPMERMLLLLKHSPARQATLDAFVAQQLDPKSENFHNWLTPQQFGERFGPSDQELQLVTSWLGEQ